MAEFQKSGKLKGRKLSSSLSSCLFGQTDKQTDR